MKGIFHLEGTVKHYDWGGFSLIPDLLKQNNEHHQTFAEYWLGIHPLGTSKVRIDPEEKFLSELIHDLPYLLKVLDVNQMLSIQVHPSKEAAAMEFERENEAGIPLDSAIRNYKDNNHKPELMVALSEFWLLHGFKAKKDLEYTMLNVVELRELLPVYNAEGIKGLYEHVMTMPQTEVNRILQPLLDNINIVYAENQPEKNDEDFWVSRAASLFRKNGNIDRGIFSFYLMNLVKLKRGEGIFQPAGVPHAYLQGQNVEIMANSDNVLRGGLTTKHIAVGELMKHIKFESTDPIIIKAEELNGQELLYRTPAPDFRLSVFELNNYEEIVIDTIGPEIVLVTEGELIARSHGKVVELKAGTPAAIALPGSRVVIKAHRKTVLFRATVPTPIAG